MISIININRLITVFCVGCTIALVSGCGDKQEEAATAPAPPTNSAPANAPASVAGEASAKQQNGQNIGNDAASRAAAYNAAKAAYESGKK